RPVPDWDRLGHGIHTMAVPQRHCVAGSRRYGRSAPILCDLEEGKFVASAAGICESGRSRKAIGLGVIKPPFLPHPSAHGASLSSSTKNGFISLFSRISTAG